MGIKDIIEELKSDEMLNNYVADFNMKTIKINGIEAVQYQWVYEWRRPVITTFTKDGVIFNIEFDYSENKLKYWKEYQAVLNSFEFKK